MVTKSKRKKQTQKKQQSKKPAVKQIKASEPAIAVKASGAIVRPQSRTPFLIAFALVAVILLICFITGSSTKPTKIEDVSTQAGEQLNVKVVGTDGDISNMNNALPSTQATGALQAQSANGATQATPQTVQPTPTSNLQASPSSEANALDY